MRNPNRCHSSHRAYNDSRGNHLSLSKGFALNCATCYSEYLEVLMRRLVDGGRIFGFHLCRGLLIESRGQVLMLLNARSIVGCRSPSQISRHTWHSICSQQAK